MTLHYQAVGWNPQKKAYDKTLALAVVVWLAIFVSVGLAFFPDATIETLLIRALGTGAFALLHVVLLIGPLSRLDRRFLPFLYNRRHLGVTTFGLGFAHGVFSLIQFHALGNVSPLVSLLASENRWDSLHHFPFQILGAIALLVLFVMAATSHDFWLKNLGPLTWKAMHMAVYVAYALLVLHVGLGALQAERSPILSGALLLGATSVIVAHLLAARKEWRTDRERLALDRDGYVRACGVDDIREGRARVVRIGAERVAIYRHERGFSAISNVCRHQGGPLGEGRIVNGCVTCPWHGYQYLAETGCSPPPFTEKVATYRVRIAAAGIFVHPIPNDPGTPVAPATESEAR